MRIAKGEQFRLPFPETARTAFPVPVEWRKLKRATRRALRSMAMATNAAVTLTPNCLRAIETGALIEQMGRKARCRARAATGRTSKASMAAYACTPEGRRVLHLMSKLSTQIASQEAGLCG